MNGTCLPEDVPFVQMAEGKTLVPSLDVLWDAFLAPVLCYVKDYLALSLLYKKDRVVQGILQ